MIDLSAKLEIMPVWGRRYAYDRMFVLRLTKVMISNGEVGKTVDYLPLNWTFG